MITFIKPIYIPIWWYSNPSILSALYICIITFTFQSGDIQINIAHIIKVPEPFIYIPIWWYSNIIQIVPFCWSFGNLHSNLVIFKFTLLFAPFFSCSIYIPIWWYSNLVLLLIVIETMQIYIPIWWYSNPYLILSHIYLF